MLQVVHQARPAHRVGFLHLLGQTLGLRHLLDAPGYHRFGRLLDLRQMLRQAAAGLQIGVKHSPVLLQILSAQLRVLAQMYLRFLGHQQVRDLESVLHPVSHFHAQHSFPV